ncbi:hypothetical protein D3C85_1145850 [compost metagenome]
MVTFVPLYSPFNALSSSAPAAAVVVVVVLLLLLLFVFVEAAGSDGPPPLPQALSIIVKDKHATISSEAFVFPVFFIFAHIPLINDKELQTFFLLLVRNRFPSDHLLASLFSIEMNYINNVLNTFDLIERLHDFCKK